MLIRTLIHRWGLQNVAYTLPYMLAPWRGGGGGGLQAAGPGAERGLPPPRPAGLQARWAGLASG